MRTIYICLATITVASMFLLGCRKDTIVNIVEGNKAIAEYGTGTVQMKLNAVVGGDEFIMYNNYTNNDGLVYRVESFQFYIDDITLKRAGYSDSIIDTLFLVDFVNTHTAAGGEEIITFPAQEGVYDGLNFATGLDGVTNHADPSLYSMTRPLSSFQNTHWDWSQGYKFFMIDGKIDSDGDDIPDMSYSYHIGLDDYYRMKDLSTSGFTVLPDETVDYVLEIDVNTILNNVDILNFSFTHSTSEFGLVETIADNSVSAITKL